MSGRINPVDPLRRYRERSKHLTTSLTSCILCRVLYPRVVPHRHVLLDCSEAKTLPFATRRPA